MRKIASHLLYTPQGLLPRAVVTINSDGVVESIEQSERLDSMAGVEFFGGIMTSPLTNAHCHLELSYLRGHIEQGGGISAFAQSMGRVRGVGSEQQRLDSALYWDAQIYAQGVGRVLDIANGTSTFDIKRNSKVDYHTFAELFGLGATTTDALVPLVERAGALAVSITPHSTYSLCESAFRAAIDADQQAPLSIHFMESRAEAELFGQAGALWEWYKRSGMAVDFLHYGSPTERIIANIPPSRKIYLIHNTYLSREDAQRLMAHFGDNLTFVLCPASNLYIEGVLPPAAMLESLGAKLALGTDSLASAADLSMATAMSLLQGQIPIKKQLRHICSGVEIGTRGLVLFEGIDLGSMVASETFSSRRIV